MENETDKLIQQQFDKIPKNVQQGILTVQWKEAVNSIGKENLLTAEQVTSLELETMFVLYGFEHPEDYVANLVRELGIQEKEAKEVANSIAENVFEPILDRADKLKKDQEKKEEVNVSSNSNLPRITPETHLATVPGERAHNVPHVEQAPTSTAPTPAPDQGVEESKPTPPPVSYPEGKDPYREPLE